MTERDKEWKRWGKGKGRKIKWMHVCGMSVLESYREKNERERLSERDRERERGREGERER